MTDCLKHTNCGDQQGWVFFNATYFEITNGVRIENIFKINFNSKEARCCIPGCETRNRKTELAYVIKHIMMDHDSQFRDKFLWEFDNRFLLR